MDRSHDPLGVGVVPTMDELTAFLTALDQTGPDAPTRCAGWTAHDLLAHMVAGTDEMARLVELAAAGEPVPPTRAFDEREEPWRAVADPELRAAFFDVGARFLGALDTLSSDQLVPFTGWAMSIDQLRTHARSELVLHRWDLVGDDELSAQLLAQPDLLAHGRAVLAAMPTLNEARRVPQPHDDLLALWGRTRDDRGPQLTTRPR
ncbi:MAG: maleylpyruvate isomerase N-terminal domain-containing protein [Microthrixaceae bacterium]